MNNKKRLTLGFSPCPNDTFIFDAMYHKRIDTGNYDFDYIIADVEELNRLAFKGVVDITKISYYSFAQLTHQYQMLTSGGALGFNCGPLLVARQDFEFDESNAEKYKLAIPGANTTANLLCSLAFPSLSEKTELVFSDIEQSVIDSKVDLGLIIHESRFTYQSKGLKKIADLGEWWQSTTNSPIPLGGICIDRTLESIVKKEVEHIIRSSVEFAFANPKASEDFNKLHSQEMSREVMDAHIDLYVNEYSIDLGPQGKQGVNFFLDYLVANGQVDKITKPVFLED